MVDYTSQIKERTDKINQNIKRSKQLRADQMTYNGFAALTTMGAIASYVGAAVTLDEKEHAWAIAFITAAIALHLVSFYCIGKSYQKGRQAMDALKHNTNIRGK